jgi:hypothetical protein
MVKFYTVAFLTLYQGKMSESKGLLKTSKLYGALEKAKCRKSLYFSCYISSCVVSCSSCVGSCSSCLGSCSSCLGSCSSCVANCFSCLGSCSSCLGGSCCLGKSEMPQIMIFSYYVPAALEAAPAAARRTTAYLTWLRRASSASGSFTFLFFFIILGKDDAFKSACAANNFQS